MIHGELGLVSGTKPVDLNYTLDAGFCVFTMRSDIKFAAAAIIECIEPEDQEWISVWDSMREDYMIDLHAGREPDWPSILLTALMEIAYGEHNGK